MVLIPSFEYANSHFPTLKRDSSFLLFYFKQSREFLFIVVQWLDHLSCNYDFIINILSFKAPFKFFQKNWKFSKNKENTKATLNLPPLSKVDLDINQVQYPYLGNAKNTIKWICECFLTWIYVSVFTNQQYWLRLGMWCFWTFFECFLSTVSCCMSRFQ